MRQCKQISFILLTAIILLMPVLSTAKDITVQGGISVFPDPSLAPKVYVEFPFSVKRADLTFLPEDTVGGSSLLTGIYAEIILFDSTGIKADSSSTYFLSRATDYQDVRNIDIKLFNKLPLLILPGKYSAELRIIDAVSKAEGVFFYDVIEIDPLVTDRLVVSSLELAHSITPMEKSDNPAVNRMIKNERYITPNPLGIYSDQDSLILTYAEIYNLDYDANVSGKVSLHYLMTTTKDSLVIDFGISESIKPGSSMVVSDRIKTDNLSVGKYHLKLIAQDMTTNTYDTSIASVIIFPTGEGEEPPIDFVSSSVEGYFDIIDVDTKVKISKYLMPYDKYRLLLSLNEQGQERLVDQFFADNDSIPETEVNEFLHDVVMRFNYANDKFSTLPGVDDGWTTDRGRILIKYGFCDFEDDAVAPEKSFPLIKWTYMTLFNGVYCVFEDTEGSGDYRLVHSNIPGEIFSQGWDDQIKLLRSPFDGVGN